MLKIHFKIQFSSLSQNWYFFWLAVRTKHPVVYY